MLKKVTFFFKKKNFNFKSFQAEKISSKYIIISIEYACLYLSNDCTCQMTAPLNWLFLWTENKCLISILSSDALMTVPCYGDNGLMYKIYNHGIAFWKKYLPFLKRLDVFWTASCFDLIAITLVKPITYLIT